MREAGRVVVEALIVAIVGSGLGFAANAMRSKRSIDIGKNYWAKIDITGLKTQPATQEAGTRPESIPTSTQTGPGDPMRDIIARLESQGLQATRHQQAAALFNDPVYADGKGPYIFIDARDDDHFTEGHIPGAKHLARFWTEAEMTRKLQELEPLLLNAEKIIVYCGGGDCEDSAELAKWLLQQRPQLYSKTFVDVDGYSAWTAAGLRTESGGGQ